MSHDYHRWPYLSPTRAGWTWIPGIRGSLRRLVSQNTTREPTATDPIPAVLHTIQETSRAADAIQTETLLLVAEAHMRGASWADIAHSLGRSKQSAHQRYQRHIHTDRTQELLADDLRHAERAAQHLRQHGGRETRTESLAFLRTAGTQTRKTA